MKKTEVGFEIGNSSLKIAVTKKKAVKVYSVPLPENLIQDGIVKIPAMMTDFLKEVRKEYKIKSGPCGFIMPDGLVIYRSMSLPPMTEKQLDLNLPFEFNDYITDEPENYVYDYSVQELVRDEQDNVTEMKLVAAATSKAKAIEYTEIFRNAGFKIQTILPKEVAITNLMKNAIEAGKASRNKEYCIVNLGHLDTKVYILKGDNLRVVRTINMGGADFDKAIAEHENVDVFMASTYKTTNYGEVMEKDYIREIFTKLSLEIIKVLNYYYFNNRDSALDRVYFAGGTSHITGLCHNIADATNLVYKPITRLLPENTEETEVASGLLALGLLMQ